MQKGDFLLAENGQTVYQIAGRWYKAFDIKERLIDENLAAELNEEHIVSIDDFKEAFRSAGPERCHGLTFDFENETFAFKLIGNSLNQEKVAAFQALTTLINKYAQVLKHASFKPAQEDNPKYAFRTWLLRLGMVGNEYKATRKLLLANLEGKGAIRGWPIRLINQNNLLF